jgi:hypothetical protein
MAEYVRFVSYLYEYQGNERKKNVGFVRYEVRAGQKRLMVSVNGVRCVDRRVPVYAFYREMDSCIGVALGTLVLRGGRGSFQYSTYADGPGEGEPECRFEEIAGVVVMGEAGAPVFCTVWDNEPFLVTSFVRCRQDLVRIQTSENPPEPAETDDSSKQEKTVGPEDVSWQKEMSPEEIQKQRETPGQQGEQEQQGQQKQSEQQVRQGEQEQSEQQVRPGQQEQSEQQVRLEQQEQSEQQVRPRQQEQSEQQVQQEQQKQSQQQERQGQQETACTAEEVSQQNSEKEAGETDSTNASQERFALYRQSLWERLCKIYPKVRPFPYNCQIGALRIRPGDIGRLPKENWDIVNNSFMLHGFFQYRYILLLHIPAQSSEYEDRYMIAVPGTYSQTDQYLADMFGFHEFLGSPKEGSEEGYFGYFMQEVQME